MKKHFSFKRITAASLAIVLAAVSLPSAHEAYAKVYGSQSGYTTASISETNYIEKNEAEATRTAVRLTAATPTIATPADATIATPADAAAATATPTEATPADANIAAATPTEATTTELNLIELGAEETIEVSSLDELLKAIDTLNKAQGGIISMTADINLGNKQKIDIKKDIRILGNDHTLTGGTALHVKSGGTLRLGDTQGENVFIFDGTYSGAEESMVVVEKNSSLVMYQGTTLKNRSSGESGIFTKRDAGGVGVYNGTFVMYGGSIENCKGYYSGGVYVDGGKFYMYDGIISKCRGQDYGAVCLDSGQFDMSGGTIQECSYPGDSSRVRYAGGVALFSESNMNMSGVSSIENCTGSTCGVYVDSKAVLYMTDYSKISGCTAKSEKAAGGIYIDGGRVIIDRGQIIENGGTSTMYPINAGGIYNDDGRLTFSGGSISNNSGSGIYAKGGLVIGTPEVSMNGGTISGNALNGIDAYEGKVEVIGGKIKDNGGSGICIGNSKPLRLENCTISGNTGTNLQHSQKGGGGRVYAYYYMNVYVGKGAVISGNQAPEGTNDKIGYGGGINIVDTCTLHIEDGAVISDNYAGRDGGGIFASVTQVYIHQGAVISSNSAKQNGGGIYGYSSGYCVLSADNGSKFYNNTAGSAGADIYLEKSCNWKAFQCEATAMDAEYHDSGRKIDGWYEDRNDKRYTPVYNGNPKSASDIRNIKTELAVVASYTVKDVRVQYEFVGEIPGGASTPDDDRIAIGAPYTPKKPSMTFTYYAFDGWYTDDKCTDKFADGTKLSVDTVLYGRWIRKYPVLYKFISGTEGMDIPEAVEDLAPADNLCYVNGTKIIALQPIYRELHAGSGTWSFAGYDKEEKIVADEDVVFTGSWNFTKDPTPETEYCVKYNFVSRTEGRSLPKAVYAELPDISKGHKKGETVTPAAPKADTVRESSGTWSFVGYNRDSAVIEDRDVVFVGGWSYTADPEYTASYSFVSGTGEALPWELWLVLPVDVKSYRTGDTVKAIQPYWSTFSVSDGTWVFAGYDKESAVVGTENVKFTGTWNYAKEPDPEPVNPHDPGTHNRGSEALGYGTVITGWYKDNSDGTAAGTWYYYDENGRLVKGWHYDTEDGKWYYLSLTDGHMLTGWQLINGKWYMFNSVTGMQTWNYNGSRWSYNGSASRPYGSMYAGETTPDNFTVDNSGAWSGGSISLDSSM